MEYTIHADSKNRNTDNFPYGNSYVLYLNKPILGVTRVDLISARLPNSMYNLTSNVAKLTTSFTSSPISLTPGFYSASTLEDELNKRLYTADETVYYSQHEGKYYYLTNDPTSTVTTSSPELAKMLGIKSDVIYQVQPLSVSINAFYYGVVSENVVDFSLNEYVFLDIEEFRGPHFSDANGEADNMFAVIPMDVYSGQIKTFKETSDYIISHKLSNKLMTLSRLTVRWYDKNLNLLNFQGFENNGFVLRVHTDMVTTPPPPQPPLLEPPLPQPIQKHQQQKKQKQPFGKWAVFLSIFGILVFWYIRKNFV